MLARRALLAAGPHGGARGRGGAARHQHVLHHRARPRPSRASRCGARCAARSRCSSAGCAVNLNAAPVRRDRRAGDAVRRHRRRRRRRDGRPRRPRAAPTSSTTSWPASGRAARRQRRPHPRLRQGPGRLRLPLRLLHHPHGARRRPLAPGERDPRRGRRARRAGPARDGDDRDQRGRLPRPRAGARAGRADDGGGPRARRRAGAALERRGHPRQGLAAARRWPPSPRSARTCTSRCSPATTTCCAAMGRHYTRRRVPASTSRRVRAAACRHVNVTTDVIVGFPTEDEAAFERTLDAVDAAGHHPRARRSRTRRGPAPSRPSAGRSRRPGREEAPLAGAARPLGGALAPAPLRASWARRERVLIDKVADTQCSGYTADYTRCYLPAGAGPRGALVDVQCLDLHADGLALPGPWALRAILKVDI